MRYGIPGLQDYQSVMSLDLWSILSPHARTARLWNLSCSSHFCVCHSSDWERVRKYRVGIRGARKEVCEVGCRLCQRLKNRGSMDNVPTMGCPTRHCETSISISTASISFCALLSGDLSDSYLSYNTSLTVLDNGCPCLFNLTWTMDPLFFLTSDRNL